MRGPIAGVHPMSAPLLFSLTQAREDLRKWTEGLTVEQVNAGGWGRLLLHRRPPLDHGRVRPG